MQNKPTQRQILPKPQPFSTISIVISNNKLVNQTLSQILFLNLLKNLIFLYIFLSVLSIPFWVFSGIQFSKIKRIRQFQKRQISISQYALLGTTGYIGWCNNQKYVDGIKQNGQAYQGDCYKMALLKLNKLEGQQNRIVNTYKQNGINNTIFNILSAQSSISPNQDIYYSSSYLQISLYYDLFLQIIFCIGIGIIQYRSFKQKQLHKGTYIQDYSLCLSNVPIANPYILLPKIQQHLVHQFNTKFELLGSQLKLFQILSVNAQKKYLELLLKEQLRMKESQQMGLMGMGLQNKQKSTKLEQIQYKIKLLGKQNQFDTIFITFQTRQARYLTLRLLQLQQNKFMDSQIQVHKAPHPLQINWNNLHQGSIKKFVSKQISLILCATLIFGFDILILFIHTSSNPLLALLFIFILEVLLKIIILSISNYQIHDFKSQKELSIFCKLATYEFINIALIYFFSSFDFGNYLFLKFFSSKQFNQIFGDQGQWYKDVGIIIMLTFCLQTCYVNLRPMQQIIKNLIKKKVKILWHRFKKTDKIANPIQAQKIDQKSKLKSDLDISYAHIISFFMFSNTYTITHPIFYPLTALSALCFLYTYRYYFNFYTQSASYNNDYLNSKAHHFLYASVVTHCFIVYIGFQFLPALVLSIIGFFILLCKTTIIKRLLKVLRKKFGPFCFSKFVRTHTGKDSLSSLLTKKQINEHITNLQRKLKMYTYLYFSKYEVSDFINRNYLQTQVESIKQYISNYQKINSQKFTQEKTQLYMKNEEKEKVIKDNQLEHQRQKQTQIIQQKCSKKEQTKTQKQLTNKNISAELKQQNNSNAIQDKCTKGRSIKGVISYRLSEDMI